MTNKELYYKILNASEIISKSSYKTSNFIIVSPIIAEAIENLDIKKHRKKKLMKINEISKKASE